MARRYDLGDDDFDDDSAYDSSSDDDLPRRKPLEADLVPTDTVKLKVGNLPFTCTSEQLGDLFHRSLGRAAADYKAEIAVFPWSLKSRGFAFVTVTRGAQLDGALHLNNHLFLGRHITITELDRNGQPVVVNDPAKAYDAIFDDSPEPGSPRVPADEGETGETGDGEPEAAAAAYSEPQETYD